MFVHNRVNTLWEMKHLILSHLGPGDNRKIGHLAYRFQALTAENRLEYRPSWISEDSHVWMTFEVHKRVMEGKVMEFYVEVRHTGSSSEFRQPGPSTTSSPSHLLALENVAMRDYNSEDDSDYEEESSCHSTEEDEDVSHQRTDTILFDLSMPHTIPEPRRLYGGILVLLTSSQRGPRSQQLLNHPPHRSPVPLLEISHAAANRLAIGA
ncbi:hypothetical protein PIB30_016558 [Stylosanthes scabra]|uniref:Uncharacterized protein n=1 Tax=Stylosanthes scabra TaxID=79078 RepID=A0ABU6R7P6_9FABA|nr:hypothetical protein [Stylosanthes scabra]